jgi:hypothetical protein
MNSDEENDCVFCRRPKTQCSGWRSCPESVYESAKVNRQEYLEKEQERKARANTEPANVVRITRPASEDGHLI